LIAQALDMINTLYLPELREMLAANDANEMREFCSALHPARTAEFMEGLDADESWRLLQHTDEASRVAIFTYLDPDKQVDICEHQDREAIAKLVAHLASDDRVVLLRRLSSATQSELLERVPASDRREIQRISQYPEGTAGAMMSTAVVRLSESLTVREALDELSRQAEMFETIYYLYVVDAEQHLRGVVSARQLVAAMRRPNTPMRELMETKLVTVESLEDEETVANRVAKLDLLAIPVVDHEHHMLGIITHDDVIDVVQSAASEDVQRLGAVEPLQDSYLRTHWLTMSWKRGVWLCILFVCGVMTAIALQGFGKQLTQWAWLIPFIPLVISSGGNSGSQSSTLVIAALTRGQLTRKDWMRVAYRELFVGLLLGLMLGCLGLMVTQVFPNPPPLLSALVVPITLTLVVTAGTLIGSLLPLLFHRLGFDPALMSNPFVAGIIDIFGIVIYMNVAMLLLKAA
jgi:magnesium transporter